MTTADTNSATTLLDDCYLTDSACSTNTVYEGGPYTLMPTSDANDEKGPWPYSAFIPVIVMLSVHLLMDWGMIRSLHSL